MLIQEASPEMLSIMMLILVATDRSNGGLQSLVNITTINTPEDVSSMGSETSRCLPVIDSVFTRVLAAYYDDPTRLRLRSWN